MYTYVSLITILTVALHIWFSAIVGVKRGKIKAPATTGTPEFERAQRVHLNTVEQTAIFLPSLWLAVPVFGDVYIALIGGVWVVGRVLYAKAYWADKNRGFGFMASFFSSTALFLIAAYDIIMKVI